MSDTTNPTNLNIINPVPKPEGLVELLVNDSLSDKYSNPMCPVCLDDLDTDSLIVMALCQHLLCLQCALGHYIVHLGSTCPYCRQVSPVLLVTTIEEGNTETRQYLFSNNNKDWCIAMSPRVDTYVICNSINQSLTIQHQEHIVQPHQEVHPLPDLDHRNMLTWNWDDDEVSSATDSIIQFLVLLSLLYVLVTACYVSHIRVVTSSSWILMPQMSSIVHFIVFSIGWVMIKYLIH